jgi:S-adenosylmethionine:tRNA ribosyltransferase-isomerase
MHAERYEVVAEATRRINEARRVVAVGTTVTRVLEHLARQPHPPGLRLPEGPHRGETDIFIHPPYHFRAIDALLTNFHLPQSTLVMLVCAFAGRALVMEAYHQAVQNRYRFYSYGDCMLIL